MGNFETKLQESFRENFPLYEYMQLSVESAPDGVFRCSVPLTRNNSNHFHTVHAALQFALAEVLGGAVWVACKPKGNDFLPVVRSFRIDFKRHASSDLVGETHFSAAQAATMKAELATKGRFDFKLESILRNAEGETIATGVGDYAIRPTPKSSNE